MWIIKAELDRETEEDSGDSGTFQVIRLVDDRDDDVTHLVDQGKHFQSMEELKGMILQSIAKTLQVEEM
jgi:type I restriction enzyme S subunit